MSVHKLMGVFTGRTCLLLLVNACYLSVLTCVLYLNSTPDFVYRTDPYYFDESNYNPNVTIFQPELRDCNFSATLKVPSSGNVTLCTYDPKVDIYVSASVQKYNEWEFKMIEGIVSLFEKDERERLNRTLDGRKSDPTNLRKTLSKDDSSLSLLDLGSNIGVFTLSIAKLGHQVLAVDAMQESLQLLATSLRMNHLADHVTLLYNALSDVRGLVHLEVGSKNKGASFIKQGVKDDEVSNITQRPPVSAICLDDLITHVRTGRVFIKMDIEGFEAKALHCALHFFATIDVPYIFMEWVFYTKNFSGAYIIDFFASRGFWPYASPYGKASLAPGSYLTWPENVFWIKKR